MRFEWSIGAGLSGEVARLDKSSKHEDMAKNRGSGWPITG